MSDREKPKRLGDVVVEANGILDEDAADNIPQTRLDVGSTLVDLVPAHVREYIEGLENPKALDELIGLAQGQKAALHAVSEPSQAVKPAESVDMGQGFFGQMQSVINNGNSVSFGSQKEFVDHCRRELAEVDDKINPIKLTPEQYSQLMSGGIAFERHADIGLTIVPGDLDVINYWPDRLVYLESPTGTLLRMEVVDDASKGGFKFKVVEAEASKGDK